MQLYIIVFETLYMIIGTFLLQTFLTLIKILVLLVNFMDESVLQMRKNGKPFI